MNCLVQVTEPRSAGGNASDSKAIGSGSIPRQATFILPLPWFKKGARYLPSGYSILLVSTEGITEINLKQVVRVWAWDGGCG